MPRKRKHDSALPLEPEYDTSKKTKVKRKEDKLVESRELKTAVKEAFTASGDNFSNTPDHRSMFVGAHISAAGGVHNAVTNAVSIGCKAFALFLKSQRQWQAKPLDPEVITKFKAAVKEHGFHPDHILPHGSYLINCGSPSAETLAKSRNGLVDELKRAELLGLTRYNFHPGSTCGKQSREKSIADIAESINFAHGKTKHIVSVIENMSCQGNTIGGKFEELAAIIDGVEDKSRIGVCLDTCHAFAAGYDLRTQEGYTDMMDQFDQVIGLDYLLAMHINDSKGECGCHLDRHELIGKGKIGKEAFKRIMNDKRLENIPLILETPDETAWQREIKLLYSLMDA
ncbi:probable endonuclease 4 [Watersipora subatra]|uniref:probable endonuclease 4 n=1 Tax=Watersipora subatra TaxID=2589382 RepID=UPI00355C094E